MTVRKPTILLALLSMLALIAAPAGADTGGFTGWWEGSVDQPSGALAMTLRLSEGDDGSITGTATMPLRALKDTPIAGARREGATVSFSVPAAGAAFECALDDTGAAMTGVMIQAGRRFPISLMRRGDTPDADRDAGGDGKFPPFERVKQRWHAIASFPGLNVDLVFTLMPSQDGGWTGTLDIPIQGITGMALRDISLGDEMRFTLDDPGEQARPSVIFHFKRTEADRAVGSFRQAGSTIAVSMERVADADAVIGPSRPQTPQPPFPYTTREVTVTSPVDGVTLASTVVIPAGQGPFPGVVFMSGSGAQDRDQTIAGHKPFLVLADRLARIGVASLRLDDRGVGGSGGNTLELTTNTAIVDAKAAVRTLATQPEVDADEVGLLGHSEGAMLAPMAAMHNSRIAFLVLLAPPAMRGDELLLLQREAVRRAVGVSGERLDHERQLHEQLIGAVERGAAEEEILADLRALAAAERAGKDDPDGSTDRVVEAQAPMLTSLWFLDFLRRDPGPALRTTRIPVLALFGERDLQVPPVPNADRLRAMLKSAGNDHAVVRVLPGLNHLFQPSARGLPNEYAISQTTIYEGAIDAVEEFIASVTSAEPPADVPPAP